MHAGFTAFAEMFAEINRERGRQRNRVFASRVVGRGRHALDTCALDDIRTVHVVDFVEHFRLLGGTFERAGADRDNPRGATIRPVRMPN